jgi:hypothetical protein
MAKKMRNDPKMMHMISEFQKGMLQDGPSAKLSPSERLAKKLENSRLSRMPQIGKDKFKESKKAELENKRKTLEKKVVEDVVDNEALVINTKTESQLKRKYNDKMKKLNKKYGNIDLEMYTKFLSDKGTIENKESSEYIHMLNMCNLYKFQHPVNVESVLDISSEEDEN